MVRAFILYYLNIKPTHGYEIQRFLQVSGTECWAKIQSGSIYYALTKLEKEGFIEVLKEERTGSRVRKIYSITSSGKEELNREMAKELAAPIVATGSVKFITDPMLSTLSKDESIKIISEHISKLNEEMEFWIKWEKVKADDDTNKLTRLSFDMTIESYKRQIQWHEELLNNIDKYIEESMENPKLIKLFDFNSEIDEDKKVDSDERIAYLSKIKEEIMKNPTSAINNLDKIINELQKESIKG